MKPCSERRYDFCTWDHPHEPCDGLLARAGNREGEDPVRFSVCIDVAADCHHWLEIALDCGHRGPAWKREQRNTTRQRKELLGKVFACRWHHTEAGMAS